MRQVGGNSGLNYRRIKQFGQCFSTRFGDTRVALDVDNFICREHQTRLYCLLSATLLGEQIENWRDQPRRCP